MRPHHRSPALHRRAQMPVLQPVATASAPAAAQPLRRQPRRGHIAAPHRVPERREDPVFRALPGLRPPRAHAADAPRNCAPRSPPPSAPPSPPYRAPPMPDHTAATTRRPPPRSRPPSPHSTASAAPRRSTKGAPRPASTAPKPRHRQPQPPLRRRPQRLGLRVQHEHRHQRTARCHRRRQHRLVRQTQVAAKPQNQRRSASSHPSPYCSNTPAARLRITARACSFCKYSRRRLRRRRPATRRAYRTRSSAAISRATSSALV